MFRRCHSIATGGVDRGTDNVLNQLLLLGSSPDFFPSTDTHHHGRTNLEYAIGIDLPRTKLFELMLGAGDVVEPCHLDSLNEPLLSDPELLPFHTLLDEEENVSAE